MLLTSFIKYTLHLILSGVSYCPLVDQQFSGVEERAAKKGRWEVQLLVLPESIAFPLPSKSGTRCMLMPCDA